MERKKVRREKDVLLTRHQARDRLSFKENVVDVPMFSSQSSMQLRDILLRRGDLVIIVIMTLTREQGQWEGDTTMITGNVAYIATQRQSLLFGMSDLWRLLLLHTLRQIILFLWYFVQSTIFVIRCHSNLLNW